MSYKESGENNNGVGGSSSPGVQHNNVYSSNNMPPTPTSTVIILGPTSGKLKTIDNILISTTKYKIIICAAIYFPKPIFASKDKSFSCTKEIIQ